MMVSDSHEDLFLCLECFGLRGRFEGKEHRCRCIPRDEAWLAAEWAGYDIPARIDMCELCGRGTMESGYRYSWLACDLCREVNLEYGKSLGLERGPIPVGRHSLMNGSLVAVDAALDFPNEFAEIVQRNARSWWDLHEWGEAEVRRLLATTSWVEEGRTEVPLIEWMTTFPNTREASALALHRFMDAPDKTPAD
jgi:hypothetical protein